MKILVPKIPDNSEVIDIGDVTSQYIIIIKFNNNQFNDWCLLMASSYGADEYVAVPIDNETAFFTENNNYDNSPYNSIEGWIKEANEAYAFKSFKEACKFLITVL